MSRFVYEHLILNCPKCYRSYEIPATVYNGVEKFMCFHCNHLDMKENFKPEKLEESKKKPIQKKDTEEKEPIKTQNFEDLTTKNDEKIEKIETNSNPKKSESITLENIDLSNQTNKKQSTSEMKKRLLVMALIVVAGICAFLIIRYI